MLVKFSSFYLCCVWKAPTVVRACKKAWCDALSKRTHSDCRIKGASFIPRRYFARTDMRLESVIDSHTTELNSASEKHGTVNDQGSQEYLFQVMSAN